MGVEITFFGLSGVRIWRAGQHTPNQNSQEYPPPPPVPLGKKDQGTIWVLAACKMEREPKNKRGGGSRERKENLSSPPIPRYFTRLIFYAVFVSSSLFFGPKPHGNTCYAGYLTFGKVF